MAPRPHSTYTERVSSRRTTALFIVLTALPLGMGAISFARNGLTAPTVVPAILGLVFLFYVLNYRTLEIRITADAVVLSFGIFTRTIAIGDIAACERDDVPAFFYYGGAGIHWMSVRGRYRLSMNVLEYPRVVIALKQRAGLVRDVSFSTRRPDDVLRAIRTAMT